MWYEKVRNILILRVFAQSSLLVTKLFKIAQNSVATTFIVWEKAIDVKNLNNFNKLS